MATKSVRRELQQHVVPERLDALRPLAPVHTMHQRFKAVLVDLSGTLHVGSQALPGAVQALQKLRAHGGLQVHCIYTAVYQLVLQDNRSLLQRANETSASAQHSRTCIVHN